jgi:hypothetical protein
MVRRAVLIASLVAFGLFLFGCVPNQPPTVSIVASPTEGPAPLEVLFGVLAYDPDGEVVSCHWDFGDGNRGFGTSVWHTYENPGTYVAKATATDNRGASVSATTTITVHPNPLNILDFRLEKDALFAYVEGRAQNTSSQTLAYAEVRAYFYDAMGNRLGEFFDNTVDLLPGQVWRFRVYYYGSKDEVARAEVRVGRCSFK